jgi:hemoglobin
MQTEPQIGLVLSVRPQITADLMARTGLDDVILARLAHGFYEKICTTQLLGPFFAARITDWAPHLERMVEVWSSVFLKTGRDHGVLIPKHQPLPVNQVHFYRWLLLFGQTARQVRPPEGAAWVIERAERITFSIHAIIRDARSSYGQGTAPPLL